MENEAFFILHWSTLMIFTFDLILKCFKSLLPIPFHKMQRCCNLFVHLWYATVFQSRNRHQPLAAGRRSAAATAASKILKTAADRMGHYSCCVDCCYRYIVNCCLYLSLARLPLVWLAACRCRSFSVVLLCAAGKNFSLPGLCRARARCSVPKGLDHPLVKSVSVQPHSKLRGAKRAAGKKVWPGLAYAFYSRQQWCRSAHLWA